MRLAFALAFLLGMVAMASAAPPAWWYKAETRIIEPNGTASNYAPVNLGQLKYAAVRAKVYLDTTLPGGAGSAIDALVASFEPRAGQGYTPSEIAAFKAENYAPANLGQLKAVAKPFYDRLLEEEIDTKAQLIARGLPNTWAYDYPWPPPSDPPEPENYAPANLGQLKLVFSFLAAAPDPNDLDGDGLPDTWETANGFDPEHPDENGNGILDSGEDPDEDGVDTLTEQLQGRNPNAGVIVDAAGDLELTVYTVLNE